MHEDGCPVSRAYSTNWGEKTWTETREDALNIVDFMLKKNTERNVFFPELSNYSPFYPPFDSNI